MCHDSSDSLIFRVLSTFLWSAWFYRVLYGLLWSLVVLPDWAERVSTSQAARCPLVDKGFAEIPLLPLAPDGLVVHCFLLSHFLFFQLYSYTHLYDSCGCWLV